MFSDEIRFFLGGSDGPALVGKRLGEHLDPTCLRPTAGPTGPTSGIMVWGNNFL